MERWRNNQKDNNIFKNDAFINSYLLNETYFQKQKKFAAIRVREIIQIHFHGDILSYVTINTITFIERLYCPMRYARPHNEDEASFLFVALNKFAYTQYIPYF